MKTAKVIAYVKGNGERRATGVRTGESKLGDMFAILNTAYAAAVVYGSATIMAPSRKKIARVYDGARRMEPAKIYPVVNR